MNCYTTLIENRDKAGVVYETIVPELDNLRLRQHLSTMVALYKAYQHLKRKGIDREPELEDYDPTLIDAAGAALAIFDQQDDFAKKCLSHLTHQIQDAKECYSKLHRNISQQIIDEEDLHL